MPLIEVQRMEGLIGRSIELIDWLIDWLIDCNAQSGLIRVKSELVECEDELDGSEAAGLPPLLELSTLHATSQLDIGVTSQGQSLLATTTITITTTTTTATNTTTTTARAQHC